MNNVLTDGVHISATWRMWRVTIRARRRRCGLSLIILLQLVLMFAIMSDVLLIHTINAAAHVKNSGDMRA